MPTGYTAGVQDGSITSFREYALRCARNFGACVMLRDEPISSDIPEFQPSSWNKDQLDAKRKEYEKWREMVLEERKAVYDHEIEQERKRNAEYREEAARTRQRYMAMLTKARQFKPPTAEHNGYAVFIVKQLEESIQFDCSNSYYDDKEPLPFDEWQRKRTEELVSQIGYHARMWEEEKIRTESRNIWVRQLRQAIDEVEPVQ